MSLPPASCYLADGTTTGPGGHQTHSSAVTHLPSEMTAPTERNHPMADQATDGPETFGPYDTEQDTTDSPLIRELRAIWPAGSKAEAAITKQHLGKALSSAYVTLGSLDARTLNWLIRFEPHHVQVIIGLISRAYAAGLSRGGEQA